MPAHKTSDGPYVVQIDESAEGQRLDNFLLKQLKGVPKSAIYRIIRKGEVRVNKSRAKPDSRLKLGDNVRVPPVRTAQRNNTVDAEKYRFLESAIVFEDDSVLVLNKPSGMAVHAGSGISVGVIEALRQLRPSQPYLELVHRLDRETSGCLVLAKKAAALKKMNRDFTQTSAKQGGPEKTYQTLVKGRWRGKQRTVTKPLDVNHRKQGERHVIVSQAGKYASTEFLTEKASDFASLLKVRLLTGRTHQVRVHALSEGHPVAGDTRYGDQKFNQRIADLGLKRLFLHASSITFRHPQSDQKVSVDAPLPEDLSALLDKI